MVKIQKIVTDVKRYKTVQQFVNESLDNITTMWLEPGKMEEIGAGIWKDLTPKMLEEFKKQVPDYVIYQAFAVLLNTRPYYFLVSDFLKLSLKIKNAQISSIFAYFGLSLCSVKL